MHPSTDRDSSGSGSSSLPFLGAQAQVMKSNTSTPLPPPSLGHSVLGEARVEPEFTAPLNIDETIVVNLSTPSIILHRPSQDDETKTSDTPQEQLPPDIEQGEAPRPLSVKTNFP